MKRALAGLLALCLAAPGPSFAGAAVKLAKIQAVQPKALDLRPVTLVSGLPSAAANESSLLAVPQNAAVSVPVAEAASLPQAEAPVQALGAVQAAAAALAAEPAQAAQVLDRTFDASFAGKGEPVAVPPSFRSQRGATFRPASLLRKGSYAALGFAAATLIPAIGRAQSEPYGQVATKYAPSTGFWVALGVLAGFVALIAATGLISKAVSKIRKIDSNEPDGGPELEPARPKPGAIIGIDPITGIPIREPATFSPSSVPVKQAPQKEAGKVFFDDVAGQDEAKAELKGIVDFLKNPDAYKSVNAKYRGPKGVLLFGPPGTGKTLMARAIANEAGIPFVQKKGSDFINTYVGTGANNIRAAFEEVRKQIKTKGGYGILFIDEIEAIGGARTGNGDRSEETRTINALLAEMDGFEKDNIIVIAATNLPESLDPALLRGGRFGRKIPVGLPDINGREAILKIHAREAKLDETADLNAVARQSPGLAGADLEQVMLDATEKAVTRGAKAIAMADLLAALDEFTIGKKRKLYMSPEDKRIISYHEAGHAIVSHLLPDADPVRKVTVIPHGLNALGFMQAMPEEEKILYSREWLVDRIAVALGGRVAEKMLTGRVFSGAQNDLQQATRIAKLMVMQFGMSDVVGHVSLDIEGQRPAVGGPLSEELKAKIDAEVRKIIDDALAKVRALLEANRPALDAMGAELMEKETLRFEDMERIIKGGAPPKAMSAAAGRPS